jgi:Tn3 transposase DDE domain
MDAALNRLRAEGHDVRREDVARLSPLGFDHINMLGRYGFTLPDTVARGELGPLRDPRTTDDLGVNRTFGSAATGPHARPAVDQNDPNTEPNAMTATSAMITPTITTITMSG